MLDEAVNAVNTQLVSVNPEHATEIKNGTIHCANDLITAYTSIKRVFYDVYNVIGNDSSLIKAGTKLDLYVDNLHLLNIQLESVVDGAPAGSTLASRATQLKGVIGGKFDAIEHRLANDWLSAYSAVRHQSMKRRRSWQDPPVVGWRSVDDLWGPLQQLKGLTERKSDCCPVCLLELTLIRAGVGT
jgi:hypothetical protein